MFKQPNNQCKRRFNTGSVQSKFALCELCFYLCSSDQKLVEASDSSLNVSYWWCSITINDWLLLCVATLCGQSIVWLIVLSSGAYWCLLINLEKKKHPHHHPCAFMQMTVALNVMQMHFLSHSRFFLKPSEGCCYTDTTCAFNSPPHPWNIDFVPIKWTSAGGYE